ncbi:hypothetical protein [Blastococcus sp. LR1]|uniref:hypothetical protein n=1 Tax=Blastococcus sp. LR1 TaxID=2877000 RepID=UPI001CCCDB82|nr:hypothetical protein [Blastococcus sp. LR1]MCA0143873.1 hypothetical protein [Blastococcus sp. LR1]
MAQRARDGRRPSAEAVATARRRHVEQVRGHRFVAGWGPKRTATVVPVPLRYWQYRPGSLAALAVSVVLVVVWVGLFGWRGGWLAGRDELPVALLAGLLIYVTSTGRVTVSDSGLSFDTAGRQTEPDAVIPAVAVRSVRSGPAPADWPRPRKRGGWLPGRTRVAVRHVGDDGEQASALWVRDPEAFADALGVPLTR